ncbi:MAG: tetratricopeptide repeat protein [Bacteroidota bacterium]|nr:tetratricopeptide repeat protein [Bacteroidota bacterium]
MPKKFHIILSVTIALIGLLKFCDLKKTSDSSTSEKTKKDTLLYLNHSDSAKYVGMNTCRLCHQNIYNTFIKTGMGKSFDLATKQKSSADFKNPTIFDKLADLNYTAIWEKDSLYFCEFRREKKDTTHKRIEQVNYIIGSGQHTNSHLQTVNGYINQMPMTYYTQKKHWDLPPGFEGGFNTRFSRKIGLECMSCHNGYPNFVLGSENKYNSIPNGIDCERCHGPGSIHVEERQTGSKIDTSKYIDYSIVNPAKLSIDLQFDLCQRCHLQGNAVLKEGKSFYDFKPGQKLSDFISVFLPKYKNADDEFIMASHADRLKQSACFIKSYEQIKNKNSLKPYKEAMTCITCHNPHVSVKETNKNVFNDACNNCHHDNTEENKGTQEIKETGTKLFCSDKTVIHKTKNLGQTTDCVSCHMPVSGSTDIPHVSVHDHYIRKPITKVEKDKIKTFVGLYSINEKNPDKLTRARAYINQYEKFDQTLSYLDSAKALLNSEKTEDLFTNIRALIQLNFIQQNFKDVIMYVDKIGEVRCYNSLFIKQSYDNLDAWTCYRIAESYYYTNNLPSAIKWFKQAVKLAPFNLEFRNKYGSALASNKQLNEAENEFKFVLQQHPKNVSAYTNLGYIQLVKGFPAEAIRLYNLALKLDPDYEPLLLNLAGYFAYTKNNKQAKYYLEKIIKKNPENVKAKQALQQINTLI